MVTGAMKTATSVIASSVAVVGCSAPSHAPGAEREISTLTGITTFSGSTAVTAQPEASYAHVAAGPLFLVDGEVSASGRPAIAVSI